MWLTVLKVNPRNIVQGSFNEKELVVLQQTSDDRMTASIEEIVVDTLIDENHEGEAIDFEIEDSEPEDEFQCNLSSSEEDEDL